MRLSNLADVRTGMTSKRYFDAHSPGIVRLYGFEAMEKGFFNPDLYKEAKYKEDFDTPLPIKPLYPISKGDIIFKLTCPYMCSMVFDDLYEHSYVNHNFGIIRMKSTKYRDIVFAILSNKYVLEYLQEQNSDSTLNIRTLSKFEIPVVGTSSVLDIGELVIENVKCIQMMYKEIENQNKMVEVTVYKELLKRGLFHEDEC